MLEHMCNPGPWAGISAGTPNFLQDQKDILGILEAFTPLTNAFDALPPGEQRYPIEMLRPLDYQYLRARCHDLRTWLGEVSADLEKSQ